MYLQIEDTFKKNSKIRASQVLFVVGALLFALIYVKPLDLVAKEENNGWLYATILVLGILFFYFICYIYIFFKGLPNEQRNIKRFFNVIGTIDNYRDTLHTDDIKILKEILEEHKIDTRPKVEEAIRHYQCLLPRKVLPTGRLISILALVISTLALLVNETVLKSTENIKYILEIIFAVILFYALICLVEKTIFRVFGKSALYTRIEESLSEIFMTYYLKKE